MTAGIWRAQVTASREFPAASGVIPWALGLARDEAIEAGASQLVVTHGAARGGDTLAHWWAEDQAANYAAAHAPIAVIPDPVPVTSAEWQAWCQNCAAPFEAAVRPPRHKRIRRPAGGTYCPEAGHRRNSAMIAREPAPSRGLAFFAGALPNRGTLDCATKMFLAGVPLWCFCDQCGPLILARPCEEHSLGEVTGGWRKRTGEGALFA